MEHQNPTSFKITEASTKSECLEIILSKGEDAFDVVLMDVNLGKESGIELTRELLEKNPKMCVIALTMHEDEFIIRQMLDAGAAGYLLKNTGGEELIRAIQTVINGEKYYSNRVALTLLNERSEEPRDNTEELLKSLSQREIQILKLIVNELTNEEIAKKTVLE